MFSVYTRHAADCVQATDNDWRRCRCPKWIWERTTQVCALTASDKSGRDFACNRGESVLRPTIETRAYSVLRNAIKSFFSSVERSSPKPWPFTA
jgi:hypothetical protein